MLAKEVFVLWALSRVSGITWTFLSSFSWQALELGDEGFLLKHGLASKYAEKAVQAIRSFDCDQASQALEKAGASILTILDPDYPELLRSIYDPPLVLFVRGEIPSGTPLVGVVGSRKATPYGRQAVEAVVPPLVAGGVTVVSGLARGIDTLAHVVTLRNGGVTVAVLGSGVDHIYPRENFNLAERIVGQGGAVVSEYPPGTPPQNYHFPARNRIISGLSSAVIVVEGDRNSGSLITAEHAMEQGRDVMAVPGSIFSPESRGPNWLISQGATPITDPGVPLDLLGITLCEGRTSDTPELSQCGIVLQKCLWEGPLDVDTLVSASKRTAADVLAGLAEMEISHLVERLPGGKYLLLSQRDCGATKK